MWMSAVGSRMPGLLGPPHRPLECASTVLFESPACAQATHGNTPARERESSIEASSFLGRRVEVLEIQEEQRPERVDRETSMPRSENGKKNTTTHVEAASGAGKRSEKTALKSLTSGLPHRRPEPGQSLDLRWKNCATRSFSSRPVARPWRSVSG